jgi:hypothetical protein
MRRRHYQCNEKPVRPTDGFGVAEYVDGASMRFSGLVLLLFVAMAVPSLANCRSQTGRKLVARLAQDGSAKTLRYLSATETGWHSFLNAVANGDRCIIDAAVRIHDVADGHFAEEIVHALGEALKTAPEAVLTSTADRQLLASICDAPDVDLEIYDSRGKALAELGRRQRAVSVLRVSTPRDQCLTHLEDAKGQIARFFKE